MVRDSISRKLLKYNAIRHQSNHWSSDGPTSEQMTCEMSQSKLWVVTFRVWYYHHEDGPMRGCNVSKSLMHEHDNQEGICGTISEALEMFSAISYLAIIASQPIPKVKRELSVCLCRAHIGPAMRMRSSSSELPEIHQWRKNLKSYWVFMIPIHTYEYYKYY